MSEVSWASVAEKIVDHLRSILVLLFLVLGVGLIVLAANKGYSQAHLSISGTYWPAILFFIGCLLLLVSIIAFFTRGVRSISLSKLQKKYAIDIQSPLENSTVLSPIQISGTCKQTGPDGCFYAIEYNPSAQRYWPKGRLTFDQKGKRWQATMNIGYGNDQPRLLIIAYLGENSRRILDYYEIVKQDTQRHIGIKEFAADFYPLQKIVIILKRPPEKTT